MCTTDARKVESYEGYGYKVIQFSRKSGMVSSLYMNTHQWIPRFRMYAHDTDGDRKGLKQFMEKYPDSDIEINGGYFHNFVHFYDAQEFLESFIREIKVNGCPHYIFGELFIIRVKPLGELFRGVSSIGSPFYFTGSQQICSTEVQWDGEYFDTDTHTWENIQKLYRQGGLNGDTSKQ